jgi:hypothetical protein
MPATLTVLMTGLAVGVVILLIVIAPPESRGSVTRLAILVIGVGVAWRVLRRAATVTASSPERFEDVLRQPPANRFEIADLRAVETDIRMAISSAFGVEVRLKPVLRELARWRLQRNRGIDMDREPDAARAVLGEPLWRLTQVADATPEFRAPGLPFADVRVAVDRLEQI